MYRYTTLDPESAGRLCSNLRSFLHVLHSHQKIRAFAATMQRLYRPFLWRSLNVSNNIIIISNNVGVSADSSNNLGVSADSSNKVGVSADSINNVGVSADSSNNVGVSADSSNNVGVSADSSNSVDVSAGSSNLYYNKTSVCLSVTQYYNIISL